MAVDWIKMRCDLQTHPKVVRISSAMCADRLRVIGGLHAVWSLFDAHSSDGALDGYTSESIDSLIGWPGFSAAMTSVGWLESNTQGVVLPRFDTHNGQSAKRRANDAERKRSGRNPQAVRNLSAEDADEMRTREEKRREEKKEQDQKLLATPAEDPDPIFGNGLAMLVRKGVPEKSARSFLGMFRKTCGDDLTATELLVKAETDDVSDPVAWLTKAAKSRKTGAAQLSLVPTEPEQIKPSHRPMPIPRRG